MIYEQAEYAKYDIDSEKMEFLFPISWLGKRIITREGWSGNNMEEFIIEEEFDKGFTQEALKKRLKADKNASQESVGGSNLITMSIKMSPEEAKALKSDEKNNYFMLYAIKNTGTDIENRKKYVRLNLGNRIKGSFLGAAIIVTNEKNSKKVLLSYGLDGSN